MVPMLPLLEICFSVGIGKLIWAKVGPMLIDNLEDNLVALVVGGVVCGLAVILALTLLKALVSFISDKIYNIKHKH